MIERQYLHLHLKTSKYISPELYSHMSLEAIFLICITVFAIVLRLFLCLFESSFLLFRVLLRTERMKFGG